MGFPPLRWCCMQGTFAVPYFFSRPLVLRPALQKWLLGFLVSLYLLSRICPNCTCTQLFLVPYSFFVFCCSRRCLSGCKHCSTAAKSPRSQPVSPPGDQSRGLNERMFTSALSSHSATGYLLCRELWLRMLGFHLSLSWMQK